MKNKSPRPPGRPRVSPSDLLARSHSVRCDDPTWDKYLRLGGNKWFRKAVAAAKLPPAEQG